MSAAVLADLQQRQEVDFSRCLGEMNGKVSNMKCLITQMKVTYKALFI